MAIPQSQYVAINSVVGGATQIPGANISPVYLQIILFYRLRLMYSSQMLQLWAHISGLCHKNTCEQYSILISFLSLARCPL